MAGESFLGGRGKINFLDDKIEFYCKMEQSFGTPDEYISKEIPYNSIPNLEAESERIFKMHDDIGRFPIYVPKIGKTIVFFVTRVYERDVHPTHDETLYGPYLAKEEVTKTEKE